MSEMTEKQLEKLAADIFKAVKKDLKKRRVLRHMDEEEASQAKYANQKVIVSILKSHTHADSTGA